jgi:hypothetical protein
MAASGNAVITSWTTCVLSSQSLKFSDASVGSVASGTSGTMASLVVRGSGVDQRHCNECNYEPVCPFREVVISEAGVLFYLTRGSLRFARK